MIDLEEYQPDGDKLRDIKAAKKEWISLKLHHPLMY